MDTGGRYVGTPAPRHVPGFAQARDAGRTPRVPGTPPHVEVHPTARKAFLRVSVITGVLVIALVAVLLGSAGDGRLDAGELAALLGVAVVGTVALVVGVRGWRRVQLAELQRGYTTWTFALGRFWLGSTPNGPVTNGWVGWRWDATWVLGSDGRVVSSPSGDGDPPGLYPSPREDGALELWTGSQWTGYLTRDRRSGLSPRAVGGGPTRPRRSR